MIMSKFRRRTDAEVNQEGKTRKLCYRKDDRAMRAI